MLEASTVHLLVLATAALGVVLAATSSKIRELPISEPLTGLVLGILLGPLVLGVLDLPGVAEAPEQWELWAGIVLAVAVTGGVLAAFAAGLAVSATMPATQEAHRSAAETANRFGGLGLFVALGIVLPWGQWQQLGWAGVGLALAVLLLRRPPWLLPLARPLGVRLPDAAVLGWFGPMGVSAVYYLALTRHSGDLPEGLVAAGLLVVASSIIAHGVTTPAGRVLYRRAKGGPQGVG